jgi:hypothetical protein
MIKNIEELSLNAWPALQTKLYDGWILRFANGYTKRSNSVNPLYHSTIPLETKIEYCENVYQQLGLPVIFKLTNDSCPQDIDKALKKRNYTRLDETSVRILDLNQYQYRKPPGIAEGAFSNEWLRDFFHCSNMSNQADQKNATGILNNITGPVIVVRKKVDGQTVGCGYGAGFTMLTWR